MEKILVIGLTPPLEGGSERHVYEISSKMPDSVVLTQQGSICKKRIELMVSNKNVFLRNISFFFSVFFYTFKLLLTPKKKFNLIHIHENFSYLLIPLLRIRYKVIVTVHGITGFSFYESKFLWFFFKIGLLLSNKIISVSISDKKLLDKEFSNVIYLPNGVDTGLYKKISHLKIEKKITFIGRIHEQKGLAFLIPAFLKLKKEYPNYRLEIIGKTEGPLYGRLSKQYQDKSIVWRGFILERKEIFSSLKSAEILVFPSQWEALPWPALLEGLGSGRPVIASDLEGMRNIFSDKKNIVLIKKADPQEIYFSIKGLIKNKKLANKIGAAGKKKAEQFSWANTCVELHNVYNSI